MTNSKDSASENPVDNPEEDTLFEFPCEYPIKVMGADRQRLDEALRQIITEHSPECADREFVVRPSKKGNFIAITCTITATSKPQLNNIYQALTDSTVVLVAL